MGDWKILDTGGTAIDIETSYNIKVQQAYGVGMPPIRNVITPYGLVDGGKFQRSIALPREFTLECIAPNVATPTQATHHTAKQNIEGLVKRDRQLTEGPVTVRYTGATSDVQIDAYYVSGLEGGLVTGNVEKFSMQMIAPDPFWKGTSLNNTALNPGTAITANHALRRTSAGSWAGFGDGGGTTTDYVSAVAEDADNIYLAGIFTTWDSGTVNNIVRYDKDNETFHALGGGGTVGVAGTINSLAIDSGGTLYIGGDFPSAGTVTTPAFTRYHETPDAFEDLGMAAFAGTLDVVLDCATDSNNDCWFVGGDITGRFMQYDGSTINAIESAGPMQSIAINTANVVTVGGIWGEGSYPGTVTSDNIAQYDITGGTWISLGSGSTQYVNSIAVNPDNTTVYTASDSSGTAVGTFQKWSGAEWTSLGVIDTDGGTQVTIGQIAYDITNDRLVAVGEFASIGGDTSLNLVSAYSFTSAAWGDIDVDLQSQISLGKAVNYYHSDTSTVFGYENTGGAPSVTVPQTTAVTNANSTAAAFPTISLLGPGSVTKIEHLTTGALLEFTGLTLLTGETMTIDLSPGAKTISTNLRSDLLSLLASGSNLGTFALMPQPGTISLQSAATVAGTISWYDTHWSIYGAQ